MSYRYPASNPLPPETPPLSAAQSGSHQLILLQAAFAAAPDALFVFDAQQQLRYANRAAGELSAPGVSVDKLLQRRCCEMFWRAEGARLCLVERALLGKRRIEIEMTLNAATDPRAVIIAAEPVLQPGVAAASGVIVWVHDISELRRVEAEAFEHKSFRASLAERTPDEIYTLDLAGCVTWMNERALQANHSLSSAIIGHPITEVIVEPDRARVTKFFQRIFAGEELREEFKFIRMDKNLQDVEAHGAPLWREGETVGALVFIRDLTERKIVQERIAQADKMRAVGELAAGVTHNLNNSLTIIQGRVELLRRRAQDDEILISGLNSIAKAAAEAGHTMQRILDFSRRESKNSFGAVNLAELVATGVEIARPKWQKKKLADGQTPAAQVTVETSGKPLVWGDETELREVLLNFIFNAVDALPQNGGEVEVGARAEIDSACFWVADSGVGMTRETLARIFEPFFTTKGAAGTGLGLSASHGIIERHGGRIIVVSEPGEGTRFEVRLPLYDELTHRSQEMLTELPGNLPNATSSRVMIIAAEGETAGVIAPPAQ